MYSKLRHIISKNSTSYKIITRIGINLNPCSKIVKIKIIWSELVYFLGLFQFLDEAHGRGDRVVFREFLLSVQFLPHYFLQYVQSEAQFSDFFFVEGEQKLSCLFQLLVIHFLGEALDESGQPD